MRTFGASALGFGLWDSDLCDSSFLICHFDFLCFIFDIVKACPELAEGIKGAQPA
jgi:hypothetical protein